MAPVPGEALDSWVEAIAHRTDTYLNDLLPALGFLPRHEGLSPARWDWSGMPTDLELESIASATGITAGQVHRMTLRPYDQRALVLNPHSRRVDQRLLWGRARGSRYCPVCLSESGGRWQVSWRLGWSFACLVHNRLLADDCPGCLRPQHMRPHSGYGIPIPGRCANTTRGSDKHPRCHHDLTSAPSLPFPAESPVLQAQHLLATCIDTGRAEFGIYAADPQPARVALADIRALAARFLMAASRAADLMSDTCLTHGIPAEVVTRMPTREHTSRFPDRPGASAPPGAPSTAAAVLAALNILNQPAFAEARQRMRSLVEAVSRVSPQAALTVSTWGADISPLLKSVHLAAGLHRRPLSEQLRHRAVTSTPRKPPADAGRATQRARKIPTLAWPGWWLRIAPAQGAFDTIMRQALSAMLLIVGSRMDKKAAFTSLGSHLNSSHMSRMLRVLEKSGHWDAVQEALTRVSDYLDNTDIPIAYHRRRHLDYHQLLPDEQWHSICRTVGISAGKQRRAGIVRAVLVERLSAQPTPNTTPRTVRDHKVKFPVWHTPALAEALDDVARAFLNRHHLAHEPLTWQPPTTLLDGLDLPGCDPHTVDLARLHQLIRGPSQSPTAAAQKLDTTPEVVRYLLALHPAPTTQRAAHGWRPNAALRYAREALPPDDLARLYTVRQRTLQQIGDQIGVSARVITNLADEYGIPLRRPREPGHNRTVHIDREWLQEQYLVRQRSATDLAAELGIGASTLLKRIKEAGIQTRTRGGGSHQRVLHRDTELQHIPSQLRPALTGRLGRTRLELFAAAAPYGSLAKAAKALDIVDATLRTAIRQVEADLGLHLIERATPTTPMQLTGPGRRILAVIHAWQRGEEAPTPAFSATNPPPPAGPTLLTTSKRDDLE
ncbi:TniQ family protein [Streptomyces sp. P3]|uniref:TniQ family protein n=1 Tax=Streptomyces sp. P3 TaxID=2135430 RepID=UPI00131F3040|nr:TniQ family protein [Streptomyces sp. P3]